MSGCPHLGRADEHCPCVDPGNENAAAAVPEAQDGREAVALALAKAADADACFDLPYVDDGSTSDAEDRDYWLRLADAALVASAAVREGERERRRWSDGDADCETCGQPIAMHWMHVGGEQPIHDGGHDATPAVPSLAAPEGTGE